jgi:(p)ppGpp synthase/HD superfamily hydrolase
MATLSRAIEIAREAHAGQVDKAGAPYITHPLRLMAAVAAAGEEAQMAAVLHDVVEDGGADWPLERLRAEGFSEAVLRAVEALTKREGEAYPDFIRRAAEDSLARLVKRADLLDNLDLSRIENPTERDFDRIEKKYRPALAYLDSLDSLP